LNTQAFDVTRQLLGPGMAMQWKEEVQVLSDAIFYGLSTLSGSQTLGEEYCDIMQVHGNRLTSLLGWERTVLLLWHILVPYMYNKIIQKLTSLSRPKFNLSGPSHLQQRTKPWTLSEENRQRLEKFLPQIVAFMNILGRVHVAVFYFSGVFYEFSKRITNVRYIFNREYNEDRPRYTILGVLILLQLGISLFIFLRQTITPEKPVVVKNNLETNNLSDLVSNTGKCSLCLEVRVNPTATSCGHLFCWDCIVEWCNNKSECPICRTPQKKNQLACVYCI